ncbi:MAG TPA: hypothetical protein VMM38_01455 [Aridibacter sp.]|nr:hypothetical protein [Aridibacter sp.]
MRKGTEIKIELLKRGLTQAEIARTLKTTSTANEANLRVMISQLINGQRWYQTLADEINEQFDLNLERPEYLRPVYERQAA